MDKQIDSFQIMIIYCLSYDCEDTSSGIKQEWFRSKTDLEIRRQNLIREFGEGLMIYDPTKHEIKFNKDNVIQFLNEWCHNK